MRLLLAHSPNVEVGELGAEGKGSPKGPGPLEVCGLAKLDCVSQAFVVCKEEAFQLFGLCESGLLRISWSEHVILCRNHHD